MARRHKRATPHRPRWMAASPQSWAQMTGFFPLPSLVLGVAAAHGTHRSVMVAGIAALFANHVDGSWRIRLRTLAG